MKRFVLLWICSFVLPACASAHSTGDTLLAALRGTDAVGVVVDLESGRVLAANQPAEAARLTATPGSALKPFFLADALAHQRIRPDTTVVCHRNLRIAHHDLACTHPSTVRLFDAEQALAYSCNSYFADLAKRLTPREAVSALQSYGFAEQPHLLAGESAGSLRMPADLDQLQLLVLGLEGVRVTPAQMAIAYRRLALRQDLSPAVRRGLEDSVVYGMAHNAATPGIAVSGKTGTASNPGESWSHGWFAGIASSSSGTPAHNSTQSIVLVLYVPHGNGADAALLAQRFLRSWAETQRTAFIPAGTQ